MKKVIIKKNVCLILAVLLVGALSLSLVCGLTAYAAENKPIGQLFTGEYESPEGEVLYNQTNTYLYNGNFSYISDDGETLNSEQVIESENKVAIDMFRKYHYFNMNGEATTKNIMNTAQITVITHGLGGDASNWSNIEGRFADDSESLISVLKRETDAQVYWAVMKDHDSFWLVDLNDDNNKVTEDYRKAKAEKGKTPKDQENIKAQYKLGSYVNPVDAVTVTKIPDISKHIILVFESTFDATIGYNNSIYEEFNYMLSKIVYDVAYLNGGILPKINLIGHSRGGITNLQYALDHPDMVESMFSMGTPYFGSDTTATFVGGMIAGNTKLGRDDIIDKSLYMDYFNRWNGNRGLYENIKVHALGGYSDLDFFLDGILDCVDNPIYDVFQPLLSSHIILRIKPHINSLLAKKNTIEAIYTWLKNKCNNSGISESELEDWARVLSDVRRYDGNSSFWDNFLHNLPGLENPYLMNDVAVPLSSQLGNNVKSEGKESYGFTTFTQCFRKRNYATVQGLKTARPELPTVVHNLESRDKTFIQYIEKNITFGTIESKWLYDTTENGTAAIYGYVGTMIDENGVLTIPSELDGYVVSEISDHAFDGIMNRNSIVSVVIPHSVKRIGGFAFSGCKGLKSVTFLNSETSTTEQDDYIVLDDSCFSDCAALTNISLPAGLGHIGGCAFANCTSLKNITLGKNVQQVFSDAFRGCKNLQSIEVENGNPKYYSRYGILYYTANPDYKILVSYPAAKNATSYTLPADVIEIASCAFEGNEKLTSVNLNNVEIVNCYAFYDCKNLATVTSEKLKYVNENAFGNTAWIKGCENNASEFFTVGNVLIKYTGDAKELILQGYTHIVCEAFADNENLEHIVFDGNSLYEIDADAFSGCSNLTEVVIANTAREVLIQLGAFKESNMNLRIYVPNFYLDSYIEHNDEYNLSPIVSTVTFDSDGGSECEAMTLYYGDPIPLLPIPQKAHNDFMGWVYSDGAPVVKEGWNLWGIYEKSATLKATWSEWEYFINLHLNGGELTEEFYPYYYSSQGKALPTPIKKGNTFEGWYDNPEYNGEPVSEIEAGDSGDKEYYAKWGHNIYHVTLNFDDSAISKEVVEIEFGSEYTLTVAQREGNIFNGWKYGNRLLTNGEGVGFCAWDIDEDVELVPDFVVKIFEIQVDDTNGHIVWMTETSFDSEKYPIKYGAEFAGFDELLAAFNPEKKNIVDGNKFVGFDIKDSNGRKFEVEFASWEGKMPDLGENGSVYYLEARYEIETDFTIVFMDYDGNEVARFTGDYGANIVKPSISKLGNTFNGWKVMDCGENYINEFIGNCPKGLAIGDMFIFSTMPDLSWKKEKDRTTIYLKADFTPKQIAISFEEYGGKTVNPTSVTFGAKTKLDITSKNGYEFGGWHFSTDGTNGCGERCSDSNGNMLSAWNRAEQTKLYANWKLATYEITYEVGDGTLIKGASYRDTFTIDTPTFSLSATAKRSGYKFWGWFTTAEFDQAIDRVEKGTFGNLTVYAKFTKYYTLTYKNTTTIFETQTVAHEEIVPLLEGLLTGHVAYWGESSRDWRREGNQYRMPNRDVTLYLTKTEARTYTIRLYHNKFNTDPANTTVTVTYGTYFSFPVNFTIPSDYHFVGWCFADVYDKGAVLHEEVCTDETGASFDTWKLDYACDLKACYCPNILDLAYYTRSGKYTITDSGRFNQSKDIIQFTYDWNFKLYEYYGYRTIRIRMYVDIAEKSDGYQYIFVYNGTDDKATYLAEVQIDHAGNKRETTASTYLVEFDIPLTEGMSGSCLCIRYGASGVGNDDWYNSNVKIDVDALSVEKPAKATCTKQ